MKSHQRESRSVYNLGFRQIQEHESNPATAQMDLEILPQAPHPSKRASSPAPVPFLLIECSTLKEIFAMATTLSVGKEGYMQGTLNRPDEIDLTAD